MAASLLFNESELPPRPVASGSEAACDGTPRLRTACRDQIEFQTLALDDLLEPDHQARQIWAFVCGLDLSPLLARIGAVEGHKGRDATDPRILLALWVYATCRGVGSARELARLCRSHNAYRWICGGVSLNYHTLADFRSKRGDFLDTLLTEIAAALMHAELVTMDRVAQDGMRVRASAGKSSFRRRATLERCLAEAQEQVAALKSELEQAPGEIEARRRKARERARRERQERIEQALKHQEELAVRREKRKKGSGRTARASTTDPEARNMKFANGGYHPGYNVQFATDTASGVIVGVDVTNEGNDMGQLSEMAAQLKGRYGRSPKEMLADGGFSSRDDIDDLETNYETRVYAPIRDEEKKLAKGIDPYARERRDTDALAAWRARMATDEAKTIYRERCATAEWANACCRNRNFWFFPVRGLWKAKAFALLHAVTHNILQTIKLRAAAAEPAA